MGRIGAVKERDAETGSGDEMGGEGDEGEAVRERDTEE